MGLDQYFFKGAINPIDMKKRKYDGYIRSGHTLKRVVRVVKEMDERRLPTHTMIFLTTEEVEHIIDIMGVINRFHSDPIYDHDIQVLRDLITGAGGDEHFTYYEDD